MSSFKDSRLGVSEGALFQIPSQTFWSPRCQNALSFWRKRFIQRLKNFTLTPWRKDSGRATAFPRLMLVFCWISCVLLLYFIPLAPVGQADFDSYTEKCQHILERCLFSSDVRPILVHPNCRQLSHLSTFPKTFARANKASSLWCDKTQTGAQKWPQKELLAHARFNLSMCRVCTSVCLAQ